MQTIHTVLNSTLAEISLKKKQVKFSNLQLKLLIERHLIPGLKHESPMFELLYQEIVYAGSYYEGLKISKPDEFDLNVVMKIPVCLEHLTVSTDNAPYEHLRIQNVRNAIEAQYMHPFHAIRGNQYKQQVANWCDHNGTFLHDEFQKWFNSLVISYIDRNKEALKRCLNKREVTAQFTQLAVTLKLEGLSIDLVPCFEFKSPLLPPVPFRRLNTTLEWYAAPGSQPDMWRLSFVKQERAMLHNSQNVKPAIKLIKKLVESKELDKNFNVKSYHIKTIALWEIHECPNIGCYNVYSVFIHLLRRLEARLRSNQLFSYWDTRLNLSARDFHPTLRTALTSIIKTTTDNFEIYAQISPSVIHKIILSGRAH